MRSSYTWDGICSSRGLLFQAFEVSLLDHGRSLLFPSGRLRAERRSGGNRQALMAALVRVS